MFFSKFNSIENYLWEHILNKLDHFKTKYIKYALNLMEIRDQLADVVEMKIEEAKEEGIELFSHSFIKIERYTDREYIENEVENILFETTQIITMAKSASREISGVSRRAF